MTSLVSKVCVMPGGLSLPAGCLITYTVTKPKQPFSALFRPVFIHAIFLSHVIFTLNVWVWCCWTGLSKRVFMNVTVISPLTLKSNIFENSKYSIKHVVMKDAVVGTL